VHGVANYVHARPIVPYSLSKNCWQIDHRKPAGDGFVTKGMIAADFLATGRVFGLDMSSPNGPQQEAVGLFFWLQ